MILDLMITGAKLRHEIPKPYVILRKTDKLNKTFPMSGTIQMFS